MLTVLVAPLAIATILGFAFAGNASQGAVPIGVSGVPPALVRAAAHASQLPPNVSVHLVASEDALKRAVADGTLEGLDMWGMFHTEGFNAKEVEFKFEYLEE